MTDTPPTQPTSSSEVFISYASQDKAVADAIVEALERNGVRCWIAPRDVRPGTVYADAIVGAINESKALVLVLSANAMPSAHVGREVERAASKRKQLIAFRVDTTPLSRELEYFLSNSQWIDVGSGGIDAAAAKLIDAIRSHLTPGPSTVPAKPFAVDRKVPSSKRRWIAIASAAVLATALVYFVADKAWFAEHPPAVLATSDKSIAVLPFTDMSEKHDQEYFGDGMAEEILNLLVKLPGIHVIGRTSSFQFKGKADDLRRIGSVLGAVYVVEGSVRRSDNHMRVTAQLIDTRDGAHRWSETYDRDAKDAIAVQDTIAAAVARALEIEVGSPSDLRRHAAPLSADAYDTYLQGLHSANRYDQQGMEEAAADFRRVLALDPSFVPAAEWLASVLETLVEWHFVPARTGWEQTRTAAEAVLKLDQKSAIAHAILALVHTEYDWDWPAANRELSLALALSPNDPYVLVSAAAGCLGTGQWARGMSYVNTALATDPLDPSIYALASMTYARLGGMAEAERTVRRLLNISPTFGWAHYWLGIVLLSEGKSEEALQEMLKETAPHYQAAGLAFAYHALGRVKESDAALARLETIAANDSPMRVAEAYAFRGQRDKAFLWLDRAFEQKDASLYYAKGNPPFRPLESDPRYKAFLRKMNLPE